MDWEEAPTKWDKYFLRIAKEVSTNSKCLSRKIGSVIVRNNSIIGTGYNGPARGMKHCNERDFHFYDDLNNSQTNDNFKGDFPTICPRRDYGYQSGQGLHLCQAGHSERNALIQCARNGISTDGAELYCYCPLPCKDCMIEIINAGISKIVCLKGEDYDKYSRVLLEESYIDLVEVDEKEI